MNEKSTTLPTHLGFIVDGNRRWARERGLPTLEGHRRGFNKVEDIAEATIEKGIKYATFYLFSTENWNRTEAEVSYLMDLARKNIVSLSRRLKKRNIKCLILGKKDPVPPDLYKKLLEAESLTADCTGGTVCLCFNYGGQQELADACSAILAEHLSAAQSSASPSAPSRDATAQPQTAPSPAKKPQPQITPAAIAAHLYHPEVPPLDLIVRTSGEERISGFMLWRAAYAEFLFMKKYFPAIEVSDLDAILAEYASRSRRFGR